ncbi:chitooligosaccharidolytic beta-N-acetylglucosaminidase [Vanessa tameamea]|uniref:Chitooligosaccharidolytic beta-N-acetylglucosaminidase n=1 Tax=Vanessa tameamea TaxID=334116 RepID=A0A8B8IRE3_VANTA|nr:chitooligosaccharidolytic beta-N-acetylglucosaminidase isoform X1 [Vanessa tameamea]XP_026499073.1 chitooligosaccharidolytic beta-N-acetylglucosaminidase isoform X1 [Vanessa tameamea]
MDGRWIVAVVVIVHLVSCNDNSIDNPTTNAYEPTWTYNCVPDAGCQRSERPQPGSRGNVSSLTYDSIDLCRTVCGRFGGLWPRPVTAALSMQTVKIHPNYLRFDLSNAPVETREILVKMTQVTTQNLIDECDGNVTEIVETPVVVYITVKTTDLDLTWETDEQYRLDVQSKEKNAVIHIFAETVYGARHGLETFSQLVSADKSDYDEQYKCSLRLVSGAKIWDKPVYKHRGFMLDTSRNFVSMDDIKRMVDAMATVKMNVFHWHVTDSHSFPLESKRVPQFTRYGAYSAYEIYSTEEVREFINYARVRGIRVVIEIDSPAHAGNGWQWGKEYGFGDLAVCVNAKTWRNLCIQPPCGQLNPANPAMYRILRDLYRDLAETLPKPALFHMGGDEVFFNCWNSSEEITSYMQSKGYEINVEGFIKLWGEFHETALKIWDEELAAVGQTEKQPVMIWSSELTQTHRIQKYLNKDRYVIEVWEPISSSLLTQLIRMGYKTISVPKDIWYLDHGFWGNTKYSNWRRMYAHTLPRDPNMLGGEVAMWSEYVDSQALDTRVWPRAAAVAERLWADPASGAATAEVRLQRVRARLAVRGVRSDALAPAWCAQHDLRCV